MRPRPRALAPGVLADDHQVVRDGLRAVPEAAGDCRVVGEEADGCKVADLVAAATLEAACRELHGLDSATIPGG